ncbi:AsmA family protein [Cellvibrio fibrivorans]|uniref:AsmA protein n=1 Tax=Cellvibrio fibrivorans TaxID=126350 RepID=A0ABU1UT40_9GAMM|nr:AsmA family protein [Cellvibrio fibrivorans]MDR7088346.1 AsmA protein [Cellvibrio fibrivorans]
MKILLKSLAILVVLVLLAALALVFLIDANRFKPRIEAIAKDQGIALQINGDLGWDLWPSLGVAVNEVRVAALEAPNQPIAELQQASLMLALMPLFSGDFQVDHIAVDGAVISLKVDANGKGNWEALSKPDQPVKPSQPEPAADTNLKLDIQHISLSNSKVNYSDAQSGQTIALRDINLTMSDVNTRAAPFALDLSFVMELAQAGADKLELQAALKNTLSVDNAMSNIKLADGKLQAEIIGGDTAEIALDYTLDITDAQKEMNYKGDIKLTEMNARKLLAALGTELETANSDAFSKVAFSSGVDGTAKKVKLDNLKLVLDNTNFSGSIGITDFSTGALKLVLDGDEINVDDYLPPPTATTEQTTAAPAEDTPLPLDDLRGLNINAKLALKKLIVNKIALENVALKVLAKNGMIEQDLTAKAYAGAITAKGQLDARGQQAQVQFDAGVEGLELEPLLKDMEMDSQFGLQGAVQARALGSTQGNSVNQLFKSLRSNATFSGAQVRLLPINLEQQFCKLVNLVNKTEDPTKVWNEYTEMNELSGSIKWRDEIITIDTFKAGVEKLQLGSTGKINLATDEYDIFLPFKLIKDKTDTITAEQVAVTTSAGGCSIGSQYWLERGMELLRCKGSFGSINPLSDCRPDKELLVELTKDYAVYKVKEKHGAKIDEKKDELKQKIEKEKNKLFDKLQQRLNKGAASSSATSADAVVAPPVAEPAAASAPATEASTAGEGNASAAAAP